MFSLGIMEKLPYDSTDGLQLIWDKKNGTYAPFFKKPSDYSSPAWSVGSSGASIFERRLTQNKLSIQRF